MSTGPPLSFHVVKNSSTCDTAGTLVPDMHGDLCLSFPVGDILSESTGNLPILQQGTAEEKKNTWRDSQHCWEEKQRRINSVAVKNMPTNYLLSLTDCDPNKTANTKERMYVITI